MLTATVSINGKSITTLSMRHDPRRGASNQFTAREWRPIKIYDGDKLTARIFDDGRTLATFELKRKTSGKKIIFSGSCDTGDVFTWANLTSGYGMTYGFTAGAMFRRSHPAPAPDAQGVLFENVPPIWH